MPDEANDLGGKVARLTELTERGFTQLSERTAARDEKLNATIRELERKMDAFEHSLETVRGDVQRTNETLARPGGVPLETRLVLIEEHLRRQDDHLQRQDDRQDHLEEKIGRGLWLGVGTLLTTALALVGFVGKYVWELATARK